MISESNQFFLIALETSWSLNTLGEILNIVIKYAA